MAWDFYLRTPRFTLVSSNHYEPVTAADLEQIQEALDRVRELINDPIALLGRARDLLEGTAQPLLAP